MHTILELLGLPPKQGVLGRSLVPLMDGTETTHRIAWSTVPRSGYFDHPRRFAVRSGSHKLIMTPVSGGKLHLELYDLASDPGERANMAQEDPALRARLFKALLRLRDGLRRLGPAQYRLDGTNDMPGVEERLRELGYIE